MYLSTSKITQLKCYSVPGETTGDVWVCHWAICDLIALLAAKNMRSFDLNSNCTQSSVVIKDIEVDYML